MTRDGVNSNTTGTISLSTTVISVVSNTAAKLQSYNIFNINVYPAYIQIFDINCTANVTLGVTSPKWSIGIPFYDGPVLADLRLGSFANGIQVAATTTPTGNTAMPFALTCAFGWS